MKDIIDCNTIYQAFSKTTLETANKTTPLKRKLNKRVPWENNKISEKREYLKQRSLVKRRAPDTYNIYIYNTARQYLVNTYMYLF